MQKSPDALVGEEGVRFDQGQGLDHDLRDRGLTSKASEVGPQRSPALVVLSGDLEVAAQ